MNWLKSCPRLPRRAFTLIELLIVVAIIAILAAIAVPNFLEAQTRSKVSRCVADMRSIITGLESYHIDNNHYPPSHRMLMMTSPVAYMTNIPNDIFANKFFYTNPYTLTPTFLWNNREGEVYKNMSGHWGIVESGGPVAATVGSSAAGSAYFAATDGLEYDPTNGTISFGRIQRFIPGNMRQQDVPGQ